MKILKIFENKLGLDPIEHRQVKTWLVDIENNHLTLSKQSTATGGGAGVSVGNVEIDLAEGISLKNPVTGLRSTYLDPDGDAWFGQDTATPSLTALAILSNAQRYNLEDFGQGDLLIGDNSTDKANMHWDASEGTLSFRAGQTDSVVLGAGGIIATWGQIGGWTIDADSIDSVSDLVVLDSAGKITAGSIELDGTLEKMTIGANMTFDGALSKITAGNIDMDGTNDWITIGANMTLDGAGSTITAGSIILDGADDDFSVGTSLVFDGATEILTVGAGATGIILNGATESLYTKDYDQFKTGWAIDSAGNAEFNNLTARGALNTAVFEKGHVIATGGNIIISKNASKLAADVIFPASYPNSVTLVIDNDDEDSAIATAGDFLYMRSFDPFASGYNECTVQVQVDGVSDNADGTSDYQCDLTGAGPLFDRYYTGGGVSNLGQDGDGFLTLEAGTYPRMIIEQNSDTIYGSGDVRVALGDLYNEYGAGANHYYGFGVGDYANGNYLAYNNDGAGTFILRTGDGALYITDGGMRLVDSGEDQSKIRWMYDDTGTERQIGSSYGDWAGVGDAVQWMTSWHVAADPWSRADSVIISSDYTGTYARGDFYSDGHAVLKGDDGTYNSEIDLNGANQITLTSVDSGGGGKTSIFYISSSGTITADPDTVFTVIGAGMFVGNGATAQSIGDIVGTGDANIRGGLRVGGSSMVTTVGRAKIEEHLFTGGGITLGYTSGSSSYPDDILFYSGTTLVGQLGASSGSTWFRLNQNVVKNIYTPRSFCAAGSLTAGGSHLPGTGKVEYTVSLAPYKNATSYTTYSYHPFRTNVTIFNGTTSGNISATKIDLSAYGIPANVQAVSVRLAAEDNGGMSDDIFIAIGPSATTFQVVARCQVSGIKSDNSGVCACDSNGDIYYKVTATGAGNFYRYLWITGYWI